MCVYVKSYRKVRRWGALNVSPWPALYERALPIPGRQPVNGALCLHVTQPEGLVSIAARIPNAKVVGHQQDEVGR